MVSGGMTGVCKQQGALILDKPYPYAQPNQLPFCNSFSECTCCNASHALTIQTVLSGAYKDQSIPGACREALKLHSCSICDPWVGTGGKKEYSRQFCDKWLVACTDTFVSQSPHTGELLWCSEESAPLICSRLSEVASSGTELCSLAGVICKATGRHGPHHSAQPVPPLQTDTAIDGIEAVEYDETGAPMKFPEASDPRGSDICLHTSKFHTHAFHGSSSPHSRGFVLSPQLLQEFLVWVVAFSALLGVLIVMVTRQRKKAKQRALADSLFSGREGGGHFDADIIREYKERYYARERGLEAALKRSNAEH